MAVNDKSLKIQTPTACLSLGIAQHLLSWCKVSTNKQTIKEHEKYLHFFFSLWTSESVPTQHTREEVSGVLSITKHVLPVVRYLLFT
jgi:hypothetical protein